MNDTYCHDEHCQHRHWTSGSMPTHRRGTDCPESSIINITRARLNEIKAIAEEYRPTMDIEVVHDWAGEAVNGTIDAEAALTAVLDLMDEADRGNGRVDVYLLDRAITDALR